MSDNSPPSSVTYTHLAAYAFIPLDGLELLREQVLTLASALGLKGTVLLAPEGINFFICGEREQTYAFVQALESQEQFTGRFSGRLFPRETTSQGQAFKRLKVKIKPEIITYGVAQTTPTNTRAHAVSPKTLQRWIDQGHDDNGKPLALLDTRNDFEVDVGTFENAIDWRIARFTQFGEAAKTHQVQLEGKTVVAFCTGGIRCEKAVLHMQQLGYSDVYQLDGGVLGYFEQVGKANWRGELFVFDQRRGVTDEHSGPR
jgi:UPF0176 protein